MSLRQMFPHHVTHTSGLNQIRGSMNMASATNRNEHISCCPSRRLFAGEEFLRDSAIPRPTHEKYDGLPRHPNGIVMYRNKMFPSISQNCPTNSSHSMTHVSGWTLTLLNDASTSRLHHTASVFGRVRSVVISLVSIASISANWMSG